MQNLVIRRPLDAARYCTGNVEIPYDSTVADLPLMVVAQDLLASGSDLLSLPAGFLVGRSIHASETPLRTLPEGVMAVWDDSRLGSIPSAHDLACLPFAEATPDWMPPPRDRSLKADKMAKARQVKKLVLRNCSFLTHLPAGLPPLHTLDVEGCGNLTSLPQDLVVTDLLNLHGTMVFNPPCRAKLTHSALGPRPQRPRYYATKAEMELYRLPAELLKRLWRTFGTSPYNIPDPKALLCVPEEMYDGVFTKREYDIIQMSLMEATC